jgi:ArsR family transcriptional regulator
MDKNRALNALSALGQDTRLDAFRLLVKAGAQGMAAGEIAEALKVRQNTLSNNLSILLNAGLVRNEREGRSVRYFADFDGVRGLLAFLMEDCCAGKPELCQPAIDQITCAC